MTDSKTIKATFGAGCFWGVEEVFRKIPGVVSTTAGYEGGNYRFPTYDDVCMGQTGHAEVVELDYDPKRVDYLQLLKAFWSIHDPTTLNRQGPDVGSQYRSVIFFHNADQERLASESIQAISKAKIFDKPIVTQLVSASTFYPAEDYHQKYFQKNGGGSCHTLPDHLFNPPNA